MTFSNRVLKARRLAPLSRNQEKEQGKSLDRLFKSSSTSRVLNLLRVMRLHGREASATGFRPIFKTPTLNKSFIIKHKLRAHERDVFPDGRLLATKILIPFDAEDLGMGGQSFFVGENNFADIVDQISHRSGGDASDMGLLRALDEIPSFDPFVLREWTKRYGFSVSPEYFQLDPAVAFRMEALVVTEVQKLVRKSIGAGATPETTRRLVGRLLSDNDTADISAFRSVLALSRDEFQEAMFGWRGFLFYKWTAIELERAIDKVVNDLRAVEVRNADPDTRRYVAKARGRIAVCLVEAYNEAALTITAYDRAYRSLIEADDPAPFRLFLREAHKRFYRLGELIAQINHVVQFWNFRSKGGKELSYEAEDLVDLLRDFEVGLGVDVAQAA